MAADLNEALKQFDVVQANLSKLERLWEVIDSLLPTGNYVAQVSDYEAYREAVRKYRFIAERMPRIDGYALEYSFEEPDTIVGVTVDYLEVQYECPCGISQYHDSLRQPGESLREYRFRVGVARRKMARDIVGEFVDRFDKLLAALSISLPEERNASMECDEWEQLRDTISSLDAVLGDSIKRPGSWGDLNRHLRFALRCDFDEIVKRDWPGVKSGLESQLYGEEDPLPVSVDDLGLLAASKPRGPVSSKLHWDRLKPDDFERLLFNLVDRTDGYENPKWLTHTNASDRGRDLSVDRVLKDPLTGSRVQRIIIACKRQDRVGIDDVPKLREQMRLWSLPTRVDELIIATSGRFSTDGIQWIEDYNSRGEQPRIEFWSDSHLERLLATRPELIAEFNLR